MALRKPTGHFKNQEKKHSLLGAFSHRDWHPKSKMAFWPMSGLGFRYQVIFGGVNQNPQVRKLKQGVDILVATPDGCSTSSNKDTCLYEGSKCLCWTKPTACSTWALFTMSNASWNSCLAKTNLIVFSHHAEDITQLAICTKAHSHRGNSASHHG